MDEFAEYFEVRQLADGVEILPGPRVLRSKQQNLVLFLGFAAAMAVPYFFTGQAEWLAVPLIGALVSALLAIGNFNLRRRAGVPLVVRRSKSISYGGESLFAGGPVREVRCVMREELCVEVVPAEGAPVVMPFPLFKDLKPEEAAVLGKLLADALGVPLSRDVRTVTAEEKI
jgi:hypothetical protein